MTKERLYVVESKGFWGQEWTPETYKIAHSRSEGRKRLARARAGEVRERSYSRRGQARAKGTYRLALYVRQRTAK